MAKSVFGPGAVVRRQVLGHRPGDAQPVEGGGAAAHLVEHDQALRGGVVQDVRRLLHLDHEGRLPARDVVGRADAREDAVDQAELGLPGRHERAALRQQRQQRHLPQVGGLAAHVRAGEHDQLMRRAVRASTSFGTKVPPASRSTTGCRTSAALSSSPSCTCGLVKLPSAAVSARPASTSSAATARAVSSTRAEAADTVAAQRLEELELALDAALVGAEHLLLVLLERRRDEALAAGDRLLADVVVGHRVQVRLRDLDVVAEDAVEAHLERLDAGARALGGFELGDDLLARAADPAQLVELGVDAVANRVAVAGQRRRLVDERGVDGAAHVGQVVERGDERAR